MGGEDNGRSHRQPVHIASPGTSDGETYGYHWWQKTFFSAAGPVRALHRSGWGGQELYLFPELDMLVAMTGGSYEGDPPGNTIIQNHILPAVQELHSP